MGQIWFNVKTGEYFEQTIHRRMTKKMLSEGGWELVCTKDHRYGPHGWAIDYAWCDVCQRYHYVYNCYNGSISNLDFHYINLLERTHDCRVAQLVYDVYAANERRYEMLLELIDMLGINGDNVEEWRPIVKKFMQLRADTRRKLLDKGREALIAYIVSRML